MRRRIRQGEGSSTPLRLRRYDPADWPNPACHPECAFWAGVEEWDDEHPDDGTAPLVLVEGPPTPWHPELI